MRINFECSNCLQPKSYDMDVSMHEINAWHEGVLIQNAMPKLSPQERDVFVLNWCYECQDEFYNSMEEDDDL